MTTKITSEDVSEWLKEQLAEAHKLHDYAHISVDINAKLPFINVEPRFSVYLGQGRHAREMQSIEECFDYLTKPPTAETIKAKQAHVEILLAEISALETQAATL